MAHRFSRKHKQNTINRGKESHHHISGFRLTDGAVLRSFALTDLQTRFSENEMRRIKNKEDPWVLLLKKRSAKQSISGLLYNSSELNGNECSFHEIEVTQIRPFAAIWGVF